VTRTFPEGEGTIGLIMIYEVANGRIARLGLLLAKGNCADSDEGAPPTSDAIIAANVNNDHGCMWQHGCP
jgi:hypothetical protein